MGHSVFARLARHTASKSRRFGKDEDGSLIIFSLMLFVLMCALGGLAMDLMKAETARVRLENTLDRATLAAAALTQDLDPEFVVRQYAAKSGLGDAIESIEVVQGMNLKDVKAKGRVDTKPMFLHMLGIGKLDAVAVSRAEQSISNAEIVLVLDVSGSMSGAKIANLKIAAMEFVDSIMASDPDHRISISIVPYNAQVNLGAPLRAKYNATDVHGVANVNCLEMPMTAFDAPGVSQTMPLPMMAFADHSSATNQTDAAVSPLDAAFAVPNFGVNFCQPSTVNVVRLPGQDADVLKAQINSLRAGGNTSITLGMKWGQAMLDPGSRDMFAEFMADDSMPDTLIGRPFDYGDNASMKVIVLMTDGEHVSHDRITDDYKSGPSPIYLSSADGNYSVYHDAHAGADKYWVPHLSAWNATPWDSGGGSVQQDWTAVWSNLKLKYVAWQFYARALGTDTATRNAAFTSAMNAMRATWASVPTMNSTLQQSCAQAKANGVLVFGIAFEAPMNGQTQISNCASSPAHYFNAQGLQIQTAFRAIASNITQLKLTQ